MTNETKEKIKNMFAPLVMEKKGDQWRGSVGRVSWWLAFAPALYIWISAHVKGNGSDISPNHLTILLTLATYNLGKKITSFLDKMYQSKATSDK